MFEKHITASEGKEAALTCFCEEQRVNPGGLLGAQDGDISDPSWDFPDVL